MSEPSQEYRDPLDEIVKRARRMETRLMRIATGLGLDPARDKDRVAITSVAPFVLELTGMDVSIGDLVDRCRKSGISQPALIRYKGRVLGTFHYQTGETHGV